MTPEMQKTQSDLAVKVRRQTAAVNSTKAYIEGLEELGPEFASDLAAARSKLARQEQALAHSNKLLAAINKIQTKIGQARK